MMDATITVRFHKGLQSMVCTSVSQMTEMKNKLADKLWLLSHSIARNLVKNTIWRDDSLPTNFQTHQSNFVPRVYNGRGRRVSYSACML